MQRESPFRLLMLLWLAWSSALLAVQKDDALHDLPGVDVQLPYTLDGRLDGVSCIELRVLEQGSDVRVTLTRDGGPDRQGVDANIARNGLHILVVCSLAPQAFRLRIAAANGTAGARVRWSQRRWHVGDGKVFLAMPAFGQALARYGDSSAAAQVGQELAQVGAFFDAIGDTGHAALAWVLATGRAERALDRPLAATAYHAALAHVERLSWTRHQVVLLNNRAVFIAPVDLREGMQLIQASFALQKKLADPRLTAIVENNVCLLRYQFGALAESEACFGRVLKQHLALGSNAADIGATRNNLALVKLAQGGYRDAESGFHRAADERRNGNQPHGQVESLCNVALSLYQQGQTAPAIAQLLDAYAIAVANSDDIGRAYAAGFLAGIYLAWGDSETAWAYASESEHIFRKSGRIANLAPQLRLVARIALARGERELALSIIAQAWALAVDNDLHQAAANIAPVHALIQVEQADYAAAAGFIATARQHLAGYAGAADLTALSLVELRLLRETGDVSRAEKKAASLDRALPYPGLARSQLLIERQLIAAADRVGGARESYTHLLASLRQSVIAAPDPELALRLQELARPVAEAAIARELDGCSEASACAAAALQRALEYFALEPGFDAKGTPADDRLAGLLQALSQVQARDDTGAAAGQLIRDIRRAQSRARRQRPVLARSPCTECDAPATLHYDVVYFFGASKSWRWQRSGEVWLVHPQPAWPAFARSISRLSDPTTRHAALRALSPLLAGLAPMEHEVVRVGGDPRLLRIPLAAIPLVDGGAFLDRHVVVTVVRANSEVVSDASGIAFLGGEGGGDYLPMAAQERTLVQEWTRRQGETLIEAPGDGDRLSLLHIVAHGQRDVGAGMAVLWLKGRPLLSYLSPGGYQARTVVINACDSGAASDSGPAQASIATAFLRNGASRVVATHFPVPDRTAAAFARAFYTAYDPRQDNIVHAVGQAQRELRRQQRDGWPAYYVVVAQ